MKSLLLTPKWKDILKNDTYYNFHWDEHFWFYMVENPVKSFLFQIAPHAYWFVAYNTAGDDEGFLILNYITHYEYNEDPMMEIYTDVLYQDIKEVGYAVKHPDISVHIPFSLRFYTRQSRNISTKEYPYFINFAVQIDSYAIPPSNTKDIYNLLFSDKIIGKIHNIVSQQVFSIFTN